MFGGLIVNCLQEQDICMVRDQDIDLRFSMMSVPSGGISGWTIGFTVKKRVDGATVFSKTTSSGIEITDPDNGIITVTVADTDTSAATLSEDLDAGERYVWDLKRTDAGSEVVMARGDFILEYNVT